MPDRPPVTDDTIKALLDGVYTQPRDSVARKVREIITQAIGERDDEEIGAFIMAFTPYALTCASMDELRDFHVRFALHCAQQNGFCADIHQYLTDCWGETDILCMGEIWHHPDTGKAVCVGRMENCLTGEHCPCGHECPRIGCRRVRYIHSQRGHHLTGTDSPSQERCITCGAVYTVAVRSDGVGRLITQAGEDASWCSGDTARVHGTERVCEAGNGQRCAQSRDSDDDRCEHVDHDCDCDLCHA